MKRFLALYLTPVVAATLILLRIPQAESFLKGHDIAPLTIGALLAAATLVNHSVNIFSPFKKYEKLEKNKWILFDRLVDDFVKQYDEKAVKLRLNIMVPERKYAYQLEPSKNEPEQLRRSWVGQIFKVVWYSKNANVNRKLRLTINQGICGKAYQEGDIFGKDFTQPDVSTFNLSKFQLEIVRDLRMLISAPIFEPDSMYNNKPSDKIVGVLNVESLSINSPNLLSKEADRVKIYEEIASLATVCGKIL